MVGLFYEVDRLDPPTPAIRSTFHALTFFHADMESAL
jgi:hypothetical protein